MLIDLLLPRVLLIGATDFSIPKVLPIGAVLFNLLFLLVAIPIEAYVLHSWLKFDKKTSTFYSIAINLFSSVIGWTIFFITEPMMPVLWKSELISYVFFNNFQQPGTQTFIILSAFIIFFTTFLLKFGLLKALLFSLSEMKKEETPPGDQIQRWRRDTKLKFQNTSLVTTTLIANSLSYTAITLIILLRNFGGAS
jgi:hypothetical protein